MSKCNLQEHSRMCVLTNLKICRFIPNIFKTQLQRVEGERRLVRTTSHCATEEEQAEELNTHQLINLPFTGVTFGSNVQAVMNSCSVFMCDSGRQDEGTIKEACMLYSVRR